MSETDPSLRNISDTARWAAVYGARENDRHYLVPTVSLPDYRRASERST